MQPVRPSRIPTKTIRVVAAVIEREGAYLITQRRPTAVLSLLWEFPGGRVEEAELTSRLNGRVQILVDTYPWLPGDYLVEITRIRKTYLVAVEAENFEALPAAVYIRGFLCQMARELQIPTEPLVTEYLKRLSAWRTARELSPKRK